MVLPLWFIPTLRLVAATVLGSLFTLLGPVGPIYCFTGVFAIWMQTQICVENSVGTSINAAGLLLGSVIVSAVAAGGLNSLALLAQAGAARTAAQCCLGVAGLIPFSVIRAGPDPASLNIQGILSTLFYGMTLVLSQGASSHRSLWRDFVGGVMQAICGAAAASLVSTLLVLPSLASEKVPELVASLIRDTGAAISSGSLLLAPTSVREGLTAAAARERADADSDADTDYAGRRMTTVREASREPLTPTGTPVTVREVSREPLTPTGTPVAGTPVAGGSHMEAALSLLFEDAAEEARDTYIRMLMAATRPTNMVPIDPLMSDDEVEDCLDHIEARYQPAVTGLRVRLAAANALLPAASVEPAWLKWTCSCLEGNMRPRFNAASWQRLLAATGVLVSRVASLECVLEEGRTLHRPTSAIAEACHTVFALSAANAAKLSLQLEAWHKGTHVLLQGSKWAGGTVGGEWMAAKELLESAFQREIGEYWQKVQAASKAQPLVVKAVRPTTSLMFLGCLAEGMMEAADELEAAVWEVLSGSSTEDVEAAAAAAAAEPKPGEGDGTQALAQAAHGLGSALDYLFGWSFRLVPLLIWAAPWRHLVRKTSGFWSLCSRPTRPGLRQLVGHRYVQAGFKFWLGCSVALVVILVLDQTVPLVAMNLPVFGFIATVAAMRERVESTLEKIAARVVGTILGATVGFGVMTSNTLANSPGALASFLAAACLLLGPMAHGHMRLMIGLVLWTFAATMLCQFNGCCGATTGHISAYISRLVSVAGGVIWTATLNRVLLPWKGSAAEIESMAEMAKTSASLMRALYEVQYDEARRLSGMGPEPANKEGTEGSVVLLEQHGSSDMAGTGVPPSRRAPSCCSAFRKLFSLAAGGLSSVSKVAWLSQSDEEIRAAERLLVQEPNGISLAVGTGLVKVQKQMEREGVPWRSGLLAVPKLARDMLTECGRLMDALEALQLAAVGRRAAAAADVKPEPTAPAAAAAITASSQAAPPQPLAGGARGAGGPGQVYCELGPAPEASWAALQQPHSGAPLPHPGGEVAVAEMQPKLASALPEGAASNAGDDIMFITFVQPLDGLIRATLEGAELLAVLVVGHCRWASDETRSALEQQIQDLIELRTSVWSALVKTRKQRLRAIRSGVNLVDMRSSFLQSDYREGAPLGAAPPLRVLVKSASEHTISASVTEAASELNAVQHSEVAVKYLAVVFALYKVNNRLMAVARMVLKYGESSKSNSKKPISPV